MLPFAKSLLLIRPTRFGFNLQTAASNSFQQHTGKNVSAAALAEFDAFAARLQEHGITTRIIGDTEYPEKPDAIFPNNWFSTHENGSLVLYPMQAENRRAERRDDIVQLLRSEYGYTHIHDLSRHEQESRFLEGTGSIVFDRREKIAYAGFSPRTNPDVLLELCETTGYLPLAFQTAGRNGDAIYHTNVLMALHDMLAVVCLDCIPDPADRRSVRRMLEISGRELLPISIGQMESFAGNMLFVKNREGRDKVILSERAWNSLDEKQQEIIRRFADPVYSPLNTIETCGGGSARCMLAELY